MFRAQRANIISTDAKIAAVAIGVLFAVALCVWKLQPINKTDADLRRDAVLNLAADINMMAVTNFAAWSNSLPIPERNLISGSTTAGPTNR